MKWKFDSYVLWPLAKKSQNWIVDQSTTHGMSIDAVEQETNTICQYDERFFIEFPEKYRTCCVQILFWMSKQKKQTFLYTTCCEFVFFGEFNEQSLEKLWDNKCKNEGFWKIFTCINTKKKYNDLIVSVPERAKCPNWWGHRLGDFDPRTKVFVQLEQLPTEWHCQHCEPFPQWFPNLELKIWQKIEHFAALMFFFFFYILVKPV